MGYECVFAAPAAFRRWRWRLRRCVDKHLDETRSTPTGGLPLSITPITSDDQIVTSTAPIGAGGYVRAEVRGQPFVDPAKPLAGRLDMEALTNPIFLVPGSIPAGTEPVTAPPGPPGPRRRTPA